MGNAIAGKAEKGSWSRHRSICGDGHRAFAKLDPKFDVKKKPERMKYMFSLYGFTNFRMLNLSNEVDIGGG